MKGNNHKGCWRTATLVGLIKTPWTGRGAVPSSKEGNKTVVGEHLDARLAAYGKAHTDIGFSEPNRNIFGTLFGGT